MHHESTMSAFACVVISRSCIPLASQDAFELDQLLPLCARQNVSPDAVYVS